MSDSEKTPSPETPQRPAGAPVPPQDTETPKTDEATQQTDHAKKREPSEIERKADELMTPEPYPDDPDSGPGKGPSFSSPTAMVGWFCLGFFFGLIGLLITIFLVWNRDHAVRSRAIMYSCIGVVAEVILGNIAIAMLGIDPNSIANMQMSASSSTSSVW